MATDEIERALQGLVKGSPARGELFLKMGSRQEQEEQEQRETEDIATGYPAPLTRELYLLLLMENRERAKMGTRERRMEGIVMGFPAEANRELLERMESRGEQREMEQGICMGYPAVTNREQYLLGLEIEREKRMRLAMMEELQRRTERGPRVVAGAVNTTTEEPNDGGSQAICKPQ